MNDSFPGGSNAALFTDLYQLTMAQAYVAGQMSEPATFSLFFRHLPDDRNFVLSCGIEDVIDFLCELRFDDDALRWLDSTGRFSDAFLDYLSTFRFTGDMIGVPDGTPVFPQEPLLEVTAPIAEAQIVETWVMNQMHVQSVLATKAARIVAAAGDRPVLDFGLRRIHGADKGLKAAKAFHVAGVSATSNVLAGRVYDLPISGTMAHSYIQAHDDEYDAFRRFAREWPDTVLLVDTFDTAGGVERVIRLADELGEDFRVTGIRIDSGDLAESSTQARKRLDRAGLDRVGIFVSGGLDEFEIEQLLVYPATHCVTYRVRLNRQCKARPAVNGQPFTRDATPQCRFRRAPEGRAGEHSSAAFCLLERTLPFPARQALQLNALRLAISYTMSGGVH